MSPSQTASYHFLPYLGNGPGPYLSRGFLSVLALVLFFQPSSIHLSIEHNRTLHLFEVVTLFSEVLSIEVSVAIGRELLAFYRLTTSIPVMPLFHFPICLRICLTNTSTRLVIQKDKERKARTRAWAACTLSHSPSVKAVSGPVANSLATLASYWGCLRSNPRRWIPFFSKAWGTRERSSTYNPLVTRRERKSFSIKTEGGHIGPSSWARW